ncbi:MAG: DUF547 domain-containing protein [Pseudomonadota bacterium]|nr:DUF547 domain-containing protein [Pseudomonadota bacterium]
MLNISKRKIFSAAAILLAASAFAEVDHGLFDHTLKSHVADGQVNYPAVAADKSYASYLGQLATAPAPSAKNDKLVFYMNAYNALAMKGILDGKSPSNPITRHLFFKSAKYPLSGGEINLHDIEHEILRKLDEPRIHFSIVCASQSCPKMGNDAFTVAKLEQQLDGNTRGFINDPSRNRFDNKEKIAYLSQVFKWFTEDFEKNAGSLQKFIAKYVSDPELAQQLAADGYTIKFLDYNWDLNGTPPAK